MAGREDEGDKRSREEHLDDGDVTVIAAEYSREWIGVIDSKALGCSCMRGGEASWLAKTAGVREWHRHTNG